MKKPLIDGWPSNKPVPAIHMKEDELGDWSYEIKWKGRHCWGGSASRHSTCLSAAKRNRLWIMRAILQGKFGGL